MAVPLRVSSEDLMAEFNQTPLARALSQPQLVLTETTVDLSPRSLPPALQPSRRRKLTSVNSIESLESLTSPSAAEARVLVINTGGTIGMTLRDNGNRSSRDSLRSFSPSGTPGKQSLPAGHFGCVRGLFYTGGWLP